MEYFRDIGSLYEIDPAALKDMPKEASIVHLSEVEKYGKRHVRYTASGREAIALALQALEEERPGLAKRCLLPAYMCDTVFFPLNGLIGNSLSIM